MQVGEHPPKGLRMPAPCARTIKLNSPAAAGFRVARRVPDLTVQLLRHVVRRGLVDTVVHGPVALVYGDVDLCATYVYYSYSSGLHLVCT